MKQSQSDSKIDVFGATVRGPAHIEERVPNQDSWIGSQSGRSRIAVVSDGLGSCKYSRDGAHAVCNSVVKATRQWLRSSDASHDTLFNLIHKYWQALIIPKTPSECACTCLFAVMHRDGTGFVAQLGDGLILLHSVANLSVLLSRTEDLFTNETNSMSSMTKASDWTWRSFGTEIKSIVLCTDGVADDIIPERYNIFVDWLVSDIRCEAPQKRRFSIIKALHNWPTPNHIDDKTIVVMHYLGNTHGT